VDTPTAISRFSASGKDAQLRLLARFGHNLTVEGRDTYVPQTDQVHAPSRLRAINEIQHRVLGHIYSLLTNSDQRYPDDVIVQIMLEHDDRLLRAQTSRAFEEAWVRGLPSNTSLERTREG
jgi:hypothetical protein